MGTVFTNGSWDRGWMPGRAIQKTQKLALDAAFLNTQHYMAETKGKVEQSSKNMLGSSLHLGVVAIKMGAFTEFYNVIKT